LRTEYEYIVVGLGGLGSAAAYWLAQRGGGKVLGLERFEVGHGNGASQDHSRIIRRSYHTPGYVKLADEAYRAWEELELEAGERLLVRTGGLDLWPAGAAIPIQDYTASMEAAGVPFETLASDEIRARWPQWQLSDETIGLFQPDGGIVPAIRCNEAHRRLAREHGATLVDRTPVTGIRQRGGELVVATPDASYSCARIVLAADAWTNGLLADLGLRLPLTITQEQVTYFAAPTVTRSPRSAFPCGSGWTTPLSTASQATAKQARRSPRTAGGGR
jgi:sarcosine oxidase